MVRLPMRFAKEQLSPLESVDPHFAPLTPLECADPEPIRLKPFGMNRSRKGGGEGCPQPPQVLLLSRQLTLDLHSTVYANRWFLRRPHSPSAPRLSLRAR